MIFYLQQLVKRLVSLILTLPNTSSRHEDMERTRCAADLFKTFYIYLATLFYCRLVNVSFLCILASAGKWRTW